MFGELWVTAHPQEFPPLPVHPAGWSEHRGAEHRASGVSGELSDPVPYRHDPVAAIPARSGAPDTPRDTIARSPRCVLVPYTAVLVVPPSTDPLTGRPADPPILLHPSELARTSR